MGIDLTHYKGREVENVAEKKHKYKRIVRSDQFVQSKVEVVKTDNCI